MPLARGTAAAGYTTMLALFWAAGMPVKVTIPTDYQVDWEAILEQHPDIFAAELSQWFVPKEARPDEYKESIRKVRWQLPGNCADSNGLQFSWGGIQPWLLCGLFVLWLG